jgi:hypothetical protein
MRRNEANKSVLTVLGQSSAVLEEEGEQTSNRRTLTD